MSSFMLAAISDRTVLRIAKAALVVVFAWGLGACATKPEPQLVSSGTDRESSLPWNEQQKWENTGRLGPMAERLQSR